MEAGGQETGDRARRARLLGALAVLAAAVLWGAIGVLSVALFRLGVTPWEVAFWRATLAALLLGMYVLLFRRSVLRPSRPADLALLAGFGVVGVGLFYVAFQLATFLTSVAVAVVLLYTAPVFVVLGARLFLGEAITRAKLVMVGLVVLGVWATALGAAGAEIRLTAAGIAWGIASALAYASYYLFGKRYVPRLGVLRTLLVSLAAGAAVLAPAAALAGHPPRLLLPAQAWGLLLALALGTSLLAYGLYYWGLAHIEAGVASVIASVEPVVAAMLALLLLGQPLTATGWLGVTLVVAGIAAPALQPRAGR